MSNLMCLHCHSDVPYGARVCRGCQAEIEYGTPPAMMVVVLVASVFLGWKVAASTHEFLGWGIFVAALGGGIYACQRLFQDRVNFKRIYRTK